MVSPLKTQSAVKPESISITQFRSNLFEIMVCENINDIDNNMYEYDMRLDTVSANDYNELIMSVVQMKYDCNNKFDFRSPLTAVEYEAFKSYFENAKAICSKYFTPSDNSDYKIKVCLTDEIATNDIYDITKMSLDDAKAYCIMLTNTNLEMFLQKNPLYSDIHNGVVKPYNVTTAKQNQMKTVFMLSEAASKIGYDYQVKWNASGEDCENWNINELYTLAFQIANYVEPFVIEQRLKERYILNANSVDELLNISYTY